MRIYDASAVALAERNYVVVGGDTLPRIAQRMYGDSGQWRRIFDANRHVIDDPELLYPGQSLRIPD